jgi:hypothetical protein
VADVGKRVTRTEGLAPVDDVMSASPDDRSAWRGSTNVVLVPYLAILFVWWIWTLKPFHHVGMATSDQLGYSIRGLSGIWDNVVHVAELQGRVTFLFTKLIDFWLAARPEHWLPNTINIVVFALSSCCFAWAVFPEAEQRVLYVWLFASVAWVGFHHLPPAAYPTINHVPFLLWPIAAWIVRARTASSGQHRWRTTTAFGALAFVTLFQYEPSALMSLVVLGWIIYREPSSDRKDGLWYALGAAVCLNLAVYIGWRLLHPTQYSGVTLGSPSAWDVFRVTVAYTVGALPFCGGYRGQVPLRWGDETIGDELLRGPKGESYSFDVLGIVLAAFALASLVAVYLKVAKPVRTARRASYALWTVVALLLLVINGPLGLSAKYTKWVSDFDATYLTSQLALYPLVMAGVLVLDWTYHRLRVRRLPVVFLGLVILVGVVSVEVHAHNERISARQRGNLARWEGAAALAAYANRVKQKDLVAPDLFYGEHVGPRDWGKYWAQFMHLRFGYKFRFHAALPPGMKSAALIRLHRFDDGGLRALSVHTPNYVAIVAKPANVPAFLTSDEGAGVSLDWSSAEALGDSGYVSLKLKKPKELLGVRQGVDPVWLFPSSGLTPRK